MRVNEPTRPTIIVAIINNLPSEDSCEVVAVVMPRVENADIVSKKISAKRRFFSVISKPKVVSIIHPMLKATIANALYTSSVGIRRPLILVEISPVKAAFTVAIIMAKVVIFIPLPVDPGEDPMSPKIMIINIVASWKAGAGNNRRPALFMDTP